jgi:hypothetical protein
MDLFWLYNIAWLWTSQIKLLEHLSCQGIDANRWELPNHVFLNQEVCIIIINYYRKLIIKITNSMELSLSWEAASSSATQTFPSILWTRRFITVFTWALHWPLSWARSIQYIPHNSISLRFISILSSHLRLGLPSGLLASDFPTGILYAFIFSACVLHSLSLSSSLTWSF